MRRSDELIAGYLDDSLTGEQAAELQRWLRAGPANVKEFTMALARDEQLRMVVASTESLSKTEKHCETQTSTQRTLLSRTFRKVTIAACLVAVIFGVAMLQPRGGSALTLAESDGLVSLRSDENAKITRLNPGETISSGTLLVQGDGAQARLSYADGSMLWLSGGAELRLTRAKAKALSLQTGTLRADVSSQPSGFPMTVRTPTAEATVQGTSFALTAANRETRLVVNDGAVSLQRLSDEQTLTVKANEQVRVSQNHANLFRAERSPMVPMKWNFASTTEDDASSVGTWSDSGTLTATPETMYLKTTGSNEIHYRAGARNCYPGLVLLSESSVVKIRYRLEEPINLGLFVATHMPSWDFSGNFRAYVETRMLPADGDGWRTATVSVQSLIPMNDMPLQPGCVVSALFATTFADDAGLEITDFSVFPNRREE